MAASLSVRQQLLGYNSAEAVKLLGLAQGTISPWRTAFASVHPYAIEHEPMELMNERLGSPAPIVEFELPHQGDLLSGVYLEVQLPALAQPDTGVRYYRNGVGLAMIERAELYSQGRLLDRVEKNYLYLNHEFHGTQSEEAVGLCDRVTIPELAQTSATGPTVTVQIPFFFARDQTTFLPINRAREACEQLRVRFVLTPLKDLVVNLHCAPAAPVYSKHVVQCYGRTTWLSERERRHLHEQREYLITTVSALATHGTPILNGVPVRTELPVGGPVKSLLFAIADDNRETVSDVQTALVPFAGNDVRRLVGKFAAVKDVKYDPNGDASTVSDYNSFDPRTERTLTNVLKLQNLADATLAHTAASVSVAEFKSGTALGQYLLTGSLDTTAVRTASSGLGYAPGDSNHPFRASSNILEYRRDGRPGSLMIPGDPFEFRAVDRDTGEEVEPLDRMQLRVDGQDRFSTQATHHHFRSRKFRRAPRRGVYSHSFATDPSGAPSGSLNFSRVNDVEIVVRPNTTNASRLFLYAEKHNLLRTDSRVFSVAHPF